MKNEPFPVSCFPDAVTVSQWKVPVERAEEALFQDFRDSKSKGLELPGPAVTRTTAFRYQFFSSFNASC